MPTRCESPTITVSARELIARQHNISKSFTQLSVHNYNYILRTKAVDVETQESGGRKRFQMYSGTVLYLSD